MPSPTSEPPTCDPALPTPRGLATDPLPTARYALRAVGTFIEPRRGAHGDAFGAVMDRVSDPTGCDTSRLGAGSSSVERAARPRTPLNTIRRRAGKLGGHKALGGNRHEAFDAAAPLAEIGRTGCDERGLSRGRLITDRTAPEARPSPSRVVPAVIVAARRPSFPGASRLTAQASA